MSVKRGTTVGASSWVAALLACASAGCANIAWPASMEDQPSIKPQEAPIPSVAGAIPVGGVEKLGDRDDAEKLENPHKGDPASAARGERLYPQHCASCHGPSGRGDGKVSDKGIATADLRDSLVCERTDGFLYGTLTAGGLVMPPLREGLSREQRWDLVSYIRKLQSTGCNVEAAAAAKEKTP